MYLGMMSDINLIRVLYLTVCVYTFLKKETNYEVVTSASSPASFSLWYVHV